MVEIIVIDHTGLYMYCTYKEKFYNFIFLY